MLNRMCDVIVLIMYLISFVRIEPNLNLDEIVTVVAEESDFLCTHSLSTQPEKVSRIMKEWRLSAKVGGLLRFEKNLF